MTGFLDNGTVSTHNPKPQITTAAIIATTNYKYNTTSKCIIIIMYDSYNGVVYMYIHVVVYIYITCVP